VGREVFFFFFWAGGGGGGGGGRVRWDGGGGGGGCREACSPPFLSRHKTPNPIEMMTNRPYVFSRKRRERPHSGLLVERGILSTQLPARMLTRSLMRAPEPSCIASSSADHAFCPPDAYEFLEYRKAAILPISPSSAVIAGTLSVKR